MGIAEKLFEICPPFDIRLAAAVCLHAIEFVYMYCINVLLKFVSRGVASTVLNFFLKI